MASVSQATFQKDSILDLLYNIVITTFKLEDDWEYISDLCAFINQKKLRYSL